MTGPRLIGKVEEANIFFWRKADIEAPPLL
jgi:hypothetical protein